VVIVKFYLLSELGIFHQSSDRISLGNTSSVEHFVIVMNKDKEIFLGV
jgi:hypothetical protein